MKEGWEKDGSCPALNLRVSWQDGVLRGTLGGGRATGAPLSCPVGQTMSLWTGDVTESPVRPQHCPPHRPVTS